MKDLQKRLWVKELHEFNKKTEEEIAIMLDIDLYEVKSYLTALNGGG